MLEFAVVVDHFFQMAERFLGLGLIHQDQQADPLHAFQVDLLSERHQSIDDQLPHFQADDAELLEIDDEAEALGRDFRDRKSTSLNSSHYCASRMTSSA